MMAWLRLASYRLGGAVLTNGVPHVAAGVVGRAFPSPFADPPGRGLSSPTATVPCGWLNLAAAHGLLCRVGYLHPRDAFHAAALGLGILLGSLMLARMFGPPRGSRSLADR